MWTGQAIRLLRVFNSGIFYLLDSGSFGRKCKRLAYPHHFSSPSPDKRPPSVSDSVPPPSTTVGQSLMEGKEHGRSNKADPGLNVDSARYQLPQ